MFDPSLAPAESHEVEEVETCPGTLSEGDNEPDWMAVSERFWREDDEPDGRWLTSFPPPPGFTGDESRPWDQDRHLEVYERECTAEEIEALEAAEAAELAAERQEEEVLRTAYLSLLRGEAGMDEAPLDATAGETLAPVSGPGDATDPPAQVQPPA